MNRYKLIIEYSGTKYHGMQKQNNLPTIQYELEKALYKYCKTDHVEYCGRTDAGVHAIGQVIHFDTIYNRTNNSIVNGINFYLDKEDISVLNCEQVDINFHSRFDAKKRYYIYKIFNRQSKLTFMKNTHLHCYQKLNIDNMQKAANYLIGKHDFTSFRGKDCNAKSPIKRIDNIVISKISYLNGDEIIIEISAQSFLYNMVRNIVGCLIGVGNGKKDPQWITHVLNAKDRSEALDTAAPYGLYFLKAEY